MNDEFIELYNASGSDHTVDSISGSGYGVVGSDGVTRCTIPNGTVIANRGHYLCVNSIGYSLASYPSGNGSTATGDATFTTDIPDNAGIAIFNNNSGGASYSLANRMDAVGSTSLANTLYKEGTGFPALVAFSIDHSFYRDDCGKGGSITTFNRCVLDRPKDTNNNAADFIFVDSNGTSAGAGQRLGAPGPQNMSAPIASPTTAPSMIVSPLDTCGSSYSAPNAVRDYTSDPPNNSTFGTVDLRFKIQNMTGGSVTRLRLRVVDLTTFPAPSGISDLRPRTSSAVVVTTDNAPCGGGFVNTTVQGTTLEQPPSQLNGGGFNSSLSVGAVTLATPLANGASIPVRVLLGIQQDGNFKLGLVVESLPSGGTTYFVEGITNNMTGFKPNAPFDFGSDEKTDISIYRPNSGQWWTRSSSDGSVSATTFGVSSDQTVPADYTGDGVTDRAVYRASTGEWYILRSETLTYYSVPFGTASDVPSPGDFEGDGKADLAVFRPATGQWYIQLSSGGTRIVQWGVSTDQPVVGDYDGDARSDIAIWRPSVGQWWIKKSGGGTTTLNFGVAGDKTVVGDYTGDRRTDVAVWRPSTGTWYILRSEDASYYAVPFGVNSDVVVPGEYDGDGKSDLAVFRPGTSTWYINNSGGSPATILPFGLNTDQPLPNTFVK